MTTLQPAFLALVLATFLLSGFVKGFVGFGPQLVAVSILGPLYGVRTALALVIVPTIAMNILQAVRGDHSGELIKRLWPYLVAISIGIWFGVGILERSESHALVVMLGVMLFVYAVVSLMRFELPSPGRMEWLTSPAMGGVSGVLAGMTGVYVFPSALYLSALGLRRERMIQGMGIVFLTVSAALAVSLGGRNLLPGNLALLSVLAVLPALAGQAIGRRAARSFDNDRFHSIFFTALAIVGASITLRALLA